MNTYPTQEDIRVLEEFKNDSDSEEEDEDYGEEYDSEHDEVKEELEELKDSQNAGAIAKDK